MASALALPTFCIPVQTVNKYLKHTLLLQKKKIIKYLKHLFLALFILLPVIYPRTVFTKLIMDKHKFNL